MRFQILAPLVRMAKWLKACRIDTVAVQATGVYWFALHDILVERGLQVTVANAHHTKNVPGRKSDVQMRFQLLRPECQWLMKLQCAFNSCANTYGLLRNSFRLEKQNALSTLAPMEKVRTIWRVRDRYVKDAAEGVQHMQKALTKMNIQLAIVISDIECAFNSCATGVSGRAIVAAILQGERDPYKLADLRNERVQASREEVARSLEGNWQEDVVFELQRAVDDYD